MTAGKGNGVSGCIGDEEVSMIGMGTLFFPRGFAAAAAAIWS